MAQLVHQCKKCKASNKRIVSFIDPKLFTDPAKATVKLAYWCSGCGLNTGIVYKCKDKDTAEVVSEFNPVPVFTKFRSDPAKAEDEEEWMEIEEYVTTITEDGVIDVEE